MSDEQNAFKKVMRAMIASMNDSANRESCSDCEQAGYLLTISGRKITCPSCYGDGTVLIRNPFSEAIGGGIVGARG